MINLSRYVTTRMNRYFGHEKSLTIRRRCDASWGIISVMCVMFLVFNAAYLKMQQPDIVEISPPRNLLPVVYITPSSPNYVVSPVVLSPKVGEATYTAYLNDEAGNVAFKFPDIVLDDQKLGRVRSQGLGFHIPDLAPGTYYLNATISYHLNPLNDAQMAIKIARIVIEPR